MSPIQQPLGPLMVDIAGFNLTAEERKLLANKQVGGVILFTRNYQNREQLSELIRQIKSIRTPELLIAVDQEGGRIQRFRNQFSTLPSPADFEKHVLTHHEVGLQLCHASAALMATEIRECGIDISFAPLLDIAHRNSKVLEQRTFSQNTNRLIALAEAFIQGMNDAGMQATGKHFPGHGGVDADSHLVTPEDNRPLEELMQRDLEPYKYLASRLGAVMTAHVAFPKITPDLPTFSSFWLQQVLRQQLHFKGVIFSDDLIMQGAQVAGDIVSRATQALQAGCDMVLICNDPEAALKTTYELADTAWLQPNISRFRLDQLKGKTANPTLARKEELVELLQNFNLTTA